MVAVCPVAPAGAAQWITSWAAAPMANVPPPVIGPLTFALNNQTVRQVLHLSAGGHRLRIRLSNEYGSKPLAIGAATIARVGADGSVDRSSVRKLTFWGLASAAIPASAPLLSDPIDLPVRSNLAPQMEQRTMPLIIALIQPYCRGEIRSFRTSLAKIIVTTG